MAQFPDTLWIDDADLAALPADPQSSLAYARMLFFAQVPIGEFYFYRQYWDWYNGAPPPQVDPLYFEDYGRHKDWLYHGSYPIIAYRKPRLLDEEHPEPFTIDSWAQVQAMAVATVIRKTPDSDVRASLQAKLIQMIESAVLSELTTYQIDINTVAWRLPQYLIAADLGRLADYAPPLWQRVITWAKFLLAEVFRERWFLEAGPGRLRDVGPVHQIITLKGQALARPNSAGLAALYAYLVCAILARDVAALETAAGCYRTYCGESQENRDYRYSGFIEGGWHPDLRNPTGIGRVGATINGQDADGLMPEETRLCGTAFFWPPCLHANQWDAIGLLANILYLLERCGYPAMTWGQFAFQRALDWLYRNAWFALPEGYDWRTPASQTGQGEMPPADPGAFDPLNPGTQAPFFAGSVFHTALRDSVNTVYLINRLMSLYPELKTSHPLGKDPVTGWYPTLWERRRYGIGELKTPPHYYLFGGYTAYDNQNQEVT